MRLSPSCEVGTTRSGQQINRRTAYLAALFVRLATRWINQRVSDLTARCPHDPRPGSWACRSVPRYGSSPPSHYCTLQIYALAVRGLALAFDMFGFALTSGFSAVS